MKSKCGRSALDQTAQADDRIEGFLVSGGILRRGRNFKRSRHANHGDGIGGALVPRRVPAIVALLETAGHEVVGYVETTTATRSPPACIVEPSITRMKKVSAPGPSAVNFQSVYRPVNAALRFSRNARIPSRMSSEVATQTEERSLEMGPSGVGHLKTMIHGFENVAHGNWRLPGQFGRELPDRSHQLGGGHHRRG